MKSNQKYFLGCSGWYYNDWAGNFYPEKLSKSRWLEYYSKQFNTVEINNTFYRFPSEKTVKGWYNKTPDNFKLTLKANQVITHRRRFKNTQSTLTRFYGLAEILNEKLGCILFQVPPQKSKDIDFLKNAVNQFDLSKNNIIEFRHPSWYNDEVYDLLNESEVGFCSVSSADLPDDLVTTANITYIRFHGVGSEKYHYLYSDKELKEWVDKLKESNSDQVFCYFNNDYNANAPKNAQMLQKMIDSSQ
ncbi:MULTISPECIES: DUF72 domain-containing protein [Methanobacterium]|jgi:uncharacterized protein YecE (DUF72 family)|uniref:DUF72 domain-containing protein n=1 Tax=Methanobacterium veterum TaxID=408577 RepID=A0A9E5A620_9EURY|nr:MULTISPECIES: DUF72 domain-containing protein [Methanobacterium]MCZ3365247.1 DUF72 domain-containing protein [Methanobacterium veterum]MCZ3373002.1 DUF72 domain-containing protein [Methanobacterium veterum]